MNRETKTQRKARAAACRMPEKTPSGQALPRSRLENILRCRRGRKNAISGKALASLIGCTERDVREETARLVKEARLPIGSHPSRGYFWIVDAKDMELATRHLKSRAVDLFARLSALQKMSVSELAEQLTMWSGDAAGGRD